MSRIQRNKEEKRVTHEQKPTNRKTVHQFQRKLKLTLPSKIKIVKYGAHAKSVQKTRDGIIFNTKKVEYREKDRKICARKSAQTGNAMEKDKCAQWPQQTLRTDGEGGASYSKAKERVGF